MTYLLDSNVFIGVMRGKNPHLLRRYVATLPTDMYSCAVVRGELRTGAEKSADPPAERALVDQTLAPHPSLPFDDLAAERYAVIRADLEAKGQRLEDLDLMIAAIALVHGLTLVTHNTKQFARVPGLAIEDWELP